MKTTDTAESINSIAKSMKDPRFNVRVLKYALPPKSQSRHFIELESLSLISVDSTAMVCHHPEDGSAYMVIPWSSVQWVEFFDKEA
ncbi:hypothetical protein KOR42_23270 [Thalassoglobus neptunius]|uniref:Uncharacterized protein n=1 Tax=Thalassoglobus neptunius TaxID=1938619 RepID=A0A5C5X7L1_9PLAN|nr:hypothetical protein KOR42_23270 [Thalassoglobus neptunius]